jgi:hypothetical protein
MFWKLLNSLDIDIEIQYKISMDNFRILKSHFKKDYLAAKFLGISHFRYSEWKRKPDKMPAYSKKLVELGAYWVEHHHCHQPQDNRQE